jgi:hypothetical protein
MRRPRPALGRSATGGGDNGGKSSSKYLLSAATIQQRHHCQQQHTQFVSATFSQTQPAADRFTGDRQCALRQDWRRREKTTSVRDHENQNTVTTSSIVLVFSRYWMLHVSTSATHVLMQSQHSQTARSVHCTDRQWHAVGEEREVSTLQTGVQDTSRNRYIIPVNYKNKMRTSCTINVIKIQNFSLPIWRAVRVFVHLAGIDVSARNARMLTEVSGYWLRGISPLVDGEMYRLELQYNGRGTNILL